MYQLTQGRLPLTGVGGVGSAADAYAKISAGTSLVQLHTALIFASPGHVRRIKSRLAVLLRNDGFSTIAETVDTGRHALPAPGSTKLCDSEIAR
jgi:dihydroorotate dehydrogenase